MEKSLNRLISNYVIKGFLKNEKDIGDLKPQGSLNTLSKEKEANMKINSNVEKQAKVDLRTGKLSEKVD